jgi:hypothetical protein
MDGTLIPEPEPPEPKTGADVLDLRAGVEAIGISILLPVDGPPGSGWWEAAVIRDRSTIAALVETALASPIDPALPARKGLTPRSLSLTFYLRDGSDVRAINDFGALTYHGIDVPRRFWDPVYTALPQVRKPEGDIRRSARTAASQAMRVGRDRGDPYRGPVAMSLGSWEEQLDRLRCAGDVPAADRPERSSGDLYWLVRVAGRFPPSGAGGGSPREGELWSLVEADTGRVIESVLVPAAGE